MPGHVGLPRVEAKPACLGEPVERSIDIRRRDEHRHGRVRGSKDRPFPVELGRGGVDLGIVPPVDADTVVVGQGLREVPDLRRGQTHRHPG